jgi:predicted nucleic acid-binding protein
VTVTLVDSNVLIDVLTEDREWLAWSGNALAACADDGSLAINPIIFAEVSIRFATIEELVEALPSTVFSRLPGKCFVEYRRRGGNRGAPLPDFYIGAHAAIAGLTLLTRDAAKYRTYFPGLRLVAP